MTIRAIIGRAEAKAQGLKRYFTGIPCKVGHGCERVVSNWGCLECRAEGNRQWYKANPLSTRSPDKKVVIKGRLKARRKRNAAHVFELKRSAGCSRCDCKHPAALQFHHVTGKIANVSMMVRGIGAGLDTILEEIDKCIVLCANCHAVEHWEKRQGHVA